MRRLVVDVLKTHRALRDELARQPTPEKLAARMDILAKRVQGTARNHR
jgi:DNA-directed RNA polymerase sigma subunit (sigma70/sigma32)